MIRRHGGEPVSAPALREIPLTENKEAQDFGRRLLRGEIDVLVLLTGVGTRFLVQTLSSDIPFDDLVRAVAGLTTVARGPKPVAALRELKLSPTIAVPEPNTWRELLKALDERVDLRGKRVAVQEYGEENPELLAGLRERGAEVLRVPIYRWSLPEDLQPLRKAIEQITAGEIDIAVFMSAIQVEHLFQVAGEQAAEPLRRAFQRVVVASIGPICNVAIQRHGLTVDLEPEHSKLGSLISALAEHAPALVRAKRAMNV